MPKSLLTTNPFLRDPKVRRVALEVSAASSSAVEGIRKPFAKRDNGTTAASSPAPRKAAASAG